MEDDFHSTNTGGNNIGYLIADKQNERLVIKNDQHV